MKELDAYQLLLLHSFTVTSDGFTDGWQAFSLGPRFGTRVTVKVKASGDTLGCGSFRPHRLNQFLSFGHRKSQKVASSIIFKMHIDLRG